MLAAAALTFVVVPLAHTLTHIAGVRHGHGGGALHSDDVEWMSREDFFALLRTQEPPTREPPRDRDAATDPSRPDHAAGAPEHLQLALTAPVTIAIASLPPPDVCAARPLESQIPLRPLLTCLALPRGPPA